VAPASAVVSAECWWGKPVVRRLAGPLTLAALTLAALLVLVPAGAALAAAPPAITAVAPSSGPTTGGTTVLITGTGFKGLSGTSAVSFGGTDAASYTVTSETQITVVTPAHGSGAVHVTVTAAGVPSSNTSADSFTFMTRYDQTDSRFGYSGTWAQFSTASAWKGSYGRASTSGASVTITFSGTRLDWIAMKGTTTGIADVYLDDVRKKTIDLANPTAVYQQNVWSTGDLTSGVHRVRIVRSSASASGKYLTIDAVDVLGSIVGTGRIEQTDTRLAYAGNWATISATGASGGSHKQANTSGASVTVDFNGTYLAWIAAKGTTLGAAYVSLDGAAAKRLDLSATTVAYQQKVWNTGELAPGDHEVKIWWDTANAAGKYISIDAFDLEGSLIQAYPVTRYEQTDPRLLYAGTWSTFSAASASGGNYKAAASGGSVKVTFSGTRLEWIATLGPAMGTADVSLDGKAAVTIPLHSAGDVYQEMVWSTGNLASGKHAVEISWNGGSASGAYISVDAFDVWGTLPSEPDGTTEQAKWVEQRLSDLSYRPGAIDGVFDSRTRAAVIAFQKWEGMTRDGVVSSAVLNRLQTASRPKPSRSGATNPWIEVNKTKQVLLYCKNGAVVWTLPVSTGSASVGIVTPSGTFSVVRKTLETNPRYLPLYILPSPSVLAIHGYPNVPTYPASHGCIRTCLWDEDALYPLIPVGTKVYVY